MRQVENIGPVRQGRVPIRYRTDKGMVSKSSPHENSEISMLKKAIKSANKGNWKDSLEEEYNSLLMNETCELVPTPKKWKYNLFKMGDESKA